MTLPYDTVKATRELRKSDKSMAALIKRVGPCQMKLRRPRDPFRALLHSIIHQQLAGHAAAAIETRLLDLFPKRRPSPTLLLELNDAELRKAGLSARKISYSRDLALRYRDRTLPGARALGALDDEAIVAQLIKVKGIGRWTVQMMLMSHFGRPDVWPVDDFGVRKGYMQCYGLDEMPPPRDLNQMGERFRPWRSVASWYFWRQTELSPPNT